MSSRHISNDHIPISRVYYERPEIAAGERRYRKKTVHDNAHWNRNKSF